MNKIEINHKDNAIYISLDVGDNFGKNLEIIKGCPGGRKYIKEKAAWKIDINYDNLQQLKKIDSIYNEICALFEKIFPVPLFHLNEKNFYKSKTNPMKHQNNITNLLLEFNHGFGLFLDVGTGKTKILVDIIYNKFKKSDKILIVCPNSVKSVWPFELLKHSWIDDFFVIEGTKNKRDRLYSIFDHIIVNYDLLMHDEKKLVEKNFDIIIFDESHNIRNESKRTQAALNIAKNCKNVYILTGTPQDKEEDIFYQSQVVNPYLFGTNKYAFRYRYFENKGGPLIWRKNPKTGKAEQFKVPVWKFKESMKEEFYKKLSYISISLTKEECMDLPPLVFVQKYTEMDNDTEKLYVDFKKRIITEIQEKGITNLNAAIKLTTKLQQLCSGFLYSDTKEITHINDFKLNTLLEILEDIGDKKVIIWCEFIQETTMVWNFLINHSIKSININSNDENFMKQKKIDIFKTEKKFKCLITSASLLSEGVTITEATYGIGYGHSFKLLQRQQLLGRNHRKGQTEKVTFIDILCHNKIDEYIYNTVCQKGVNAAVLREKLSIKNLLENI